ncbi:RNA methyltransferase [Microbacterium sp. M28]|uniref:TrmH family RNA methyltransferase n=1 Tax=Microbacterium sp. M28 TaxID=2962064 RepID=UPI0021F4486F|nr:RNA methyltransferase [Microbacterium sp. M28]UYO95662.1 RNA methyltransferase [Microbacterium sp. M28]
MTDADDPRLDDYRDLTDTALRRVQEPVGGLYIAESAKVIERACAAGHRPRSVMTQRRWVSGIASILGDQDVPVYLVPDEVAERVTGYAVHRGALASMHRPALPSVGEMIDRVSTTAGPRVRIAVLEGLLDHTNVCGPKLAHPEPAAEPRRRSRIAVLEGLVDHTNVGSAFRNAAALGLDAVLVSPTCADPLYRRSVRVSMGTVFQVPWTRIPDWTKGIAELKAAGYVLAGMTLGEGAITLDELVAEDHEKLALVFGTEGHGITRETDALLDRRVTIPMMGGVDSLNVTAAAAVAFYATR